MKPIPASNVIPRTNSYQVPAVDKNETVIQTPGNLIITDKNKAKWIGSPFGLIRYAKQNRVDYNTSVQIGSFNHFQFNLDYLAYFIQTNHELIISKTEEWNQRKILISGPTSHVQWSNYVSTYLGVSIESAFYLFDASEFTCLLHITIPKLKSFSFGSTSGFWERFAAITVSTDGDLTLYQPLLPPNFPILKVEQNQIISEIPEMSKIFENPYSNGQLFSPTPFPLQHSMGPINFAEWTSDGIIAATSDKIMIFSKFDVPSFLTPSKAIPLEATRIIHVTDLVSIRPIYAPTPGALVITKTQCFTYDSRNSKYVLKIPESSNKKIIGGDEEIILFEDGTIANRPEKSTAADESVISSLGVEITLLKERAFILKETMLEKQRKLQEKETQLGMKARNLLFLMDTWPSNSDIKCLLQKYDSLAERSLKILSISSQKTTESEIEKYKEIFPSALNEKQRQIDEHRNVLNGLISKLDAIQKSEKK